MLIYEHFDDGKICPLCRIRSVIDQRLTEQYLGGLHEERSKRARFLRRTLRQTLLSPLETWFGVTDFDQTQKKDG